MNESAAAKLQQAPQRPLTLLICDDHDIVHAGFELLFQNSPDVRIVGHAKDGAEGAEEYKRLRPDVVLMDLSMPPGMGGIEATEIIVSRIDKSAKIGIFTAHDSDFDVLRALEAGASGFVVKDAPREEMDAAIKNIGAGGAPISPRLADILVKQARRRPEILTPREIEVLQLVARGHTNAAIARHIKVSDGTVKGHLTSIFGKLRTDDRTRAVVEAYKQGLIRFDD